ncbi:MAG TPA: hypothetical protein VJ461_01510 [Candidatus Nanoarchaeia archaeon]|nr:hypothetical protein [Candidatus Nanoarchaeia archaeon]
MLREVRAGDDMPDFKAELDYAYELVRRRFRIDFAKPEFSVFSSDDFIDKVRQPKSMKDFFEPIPNMFIDNKDHLMVVYDQKQPSKDYELIYSFMHELGHFWEFRLNRELTSDNVFSIIDYHHPQREKGVVLFAFSEGIAELIAQESSMISESASLKQFSSDHGKERQDGLDDFLKHELDLLAYVYKSDRENESELLLKFMKKNNGLTLEVNAHVFGYDFALRHKDLSVRKMIMHPPHTYSDFFLPEAYRQKLSKLS